MKIEYSNFSPAREPRAIPESCPAELRTKIEKAREQRTAKKPEDLVSVEEQAETLKKFASTLEA
jgi:hypothetical protein